MTTDGKCKPGALRLKPIGTYITQSHFKLQILHLCLSSGACLDPKKGREGEREGWMEGEVVYRGLSRNIAATVTAVYVASW